MVLWEKRNINTCIYLLVYSYVLQSTAIQSSQIYPHALRSTRSTVFVSLSILRPVHSGLLQVYCSLQSIPRSVAHFSLSRSTDRRSLPVYCSPLLSTVYSITPSSSARRSRGNRLGVCPPRCSAVCSRWRCCALVRRAPKVKWGRTLWPGWRCASCSAHCTASPFKEYSQVESTAI